MGAAGMSWNKAPGIAREAAIVAAYLAAYLLLDALSYVQPVLRLGITPWNPQAGLTLAFLIAYGPRKAPWTAAAALLAEVLIHGAPVPWPWLALSSGLIAAGYGAAAVILRGRGLRQPISSPATAGWLIGVSAAITLCVASAYVAVFVAAGVIPADAVVGDILRYWVGDLNGTITLAPLLLLAPTARSLAADLRAAPMIVMAQAAALMATLLLIFGWTNSEELRFFYPIFVPVVWITLRWGVPGALLSVLLVQVGLIVGLQSQPDYGPLVRTQFLTMALGFTALILGAVVTERAHALRRVAAREAEQRALLAAAPDAVIAIDDQRHVVTANRAASEMFGTEQGALEGQSIDPYLPGLDLCPDLGRSSLEGCRANGQRFPSDVAWARLEPPAAPGFTIIIRDASERQAAATQLRERDTALARSMRFAVAGELASALTHELNQPITALVSYLRAAEIMAAPVSGQDERLVETLGKAARESIRAADVLRRLRDFYQGGKSKLAPVRPDEVCEAAWQAFLERTRRAGARLLLDIQPGLPTVTADRIQIEMVLHNLLANAVDAVSTHATDGRLVRLSASDAGEDLVLAVEDSGLGIPPDVAPRLFEPFFTTKPDGMGLGLAISRSLLHNQGASLEVGPSTLGGARFSIRIPKTSTHGL